MWFSYGMLGDTDRRQDPKGEDVGAIQEQEPQDNVLDQDLAF